MPAAMTSRRVAAVTTTLVAAVAAVTTSTLPGLDADGASSAPPCTPTAEQSCIVETVPTTSGASTSTSSSTTATTTTTTTTTAVTTSVAVDPDDDDDPVASVPATPATPETTVLTPSPPTTSLSTVGEEPAPAALAVVPPVLVGVDGVCFAADAPESGVIAPQFINAADEGFELLVTVEGPTTQSQTTQAPPGGTGGTNYSVVFSGLPPGSYVLTAANDAGSVTRTVDVEPCADPSPPPTPGCTVALRDDVFVVRPFDRLVVDAPGVLRNDETCGAPALAGTFVRPSGAVSFPDTDITGGVIQIPYLVSPSPGVTHEATLTIAVGGEPCTFGERDADFLVVGGDTVSIPLAHVFDTDCPNAVRVRQTIGLDHGTIEIDDAAIRYTPDPGFVGVEEFDVLGHRHGDIAPEWQPTVRIHVAAPPPCVSAVADDRFEVTAGGTLLLPAAEGPAANDVVCDGDQFELVSRPASGEVGLEPSGAFTYVADSEFTGTVEFTYRLAAGDNPDGPSFADGAAATTAPATVTIVVSAPEPPPLPSSSVPPASSTPPVSSPPVTTGPQPTPTTGDGPTPAPTTLPSPLSPPPGRLPATQ